MGRSWSGIAIALGMLACAPAQAQNIWCCGELINVGGPPGSVRSCALDRFPWAMGRVCHNLRAQRKLCVDLDPYCPGGRASPEEILHVSLPCSGDGWDYVPPEHQPKDTPLRTEDAAVKAFVAGLRAAGVVVQPQHILAWKDGDLVRFQIRLGHDGCPAPNIACIYEGIAKDKVKANSQQGAPRLVFGSIQRSGNTTRVSSRIVVTETGVVEKANNGDAAGTGFAALAKAFAESFKGLGLACTHGRGLDGLK